MQRRALIGSGLFALGAAAFAPAVGWRSLFDGRSLAAFDPVGDANWALKDRAVQADAGVGFLVSRESFGNVAIRAEFWISDDANSGIFIRCADPQRITLDSAYEVNLFDQRPDPTYATGAIVDVAKVEGVTAGGRWGLMVIEAKDDRFSVWVNGQHTVDGARDNRLSHGRIALQRTQGLVKFRRLQVRAL